MGDSTNSARGVPPRGTGPDTHSGGGQRETVLLGDIGEPAPPLELSPGSPRQPFNEDTIVVPRAASPKFNLDSNVFAALDQRYEILGEAGHGSMGNVYKARDRETGETVALKLLKPEIASDQAMMDRFKNELLYARKITHKNVCRVYEFNRVAGVAYTSMEFVEGESLRSVLNRFGALSQKKATDLALQICSGLKEAHAQGIVHRDLKPENVMIDGSGNLKLMDFGIARSMEAVTRMTGVMVGTPAYMAPEQVSGSAVDYRTDIYSLGLMLYEMFTGKPAFTAENAIAVALKQMREDPPRPGEVEPSIPLPIERAILRCLEKSPEKRFQTVAALESALQAHVQAGTNPRSGVVPDVIRPLAAAASPARAAVVPARPAKSTGQYAALWAVLATLFVVSCLAGGWYWRSAMNSTANISGPPPTPAPAPPNFAYEIPAAAVNVNAAPAEKFAPPVAGPAKPVKPVHTLAEARPKPAAPEVFPRMETGPAKRQLPDPSKWIAAQKANAQQAKQSKPADFVYLKTGIYLRDDKAQEEAKKIRALGLPAMVKSWPAGKSSIYMTLCGPIVAGGAKAVTDQLKAEGFKGVQKVSVATVQ
jgi:serine/threonine protein kinase